MLPRDVGMRLTVLRKVTTDETSTIFGTEGCVNNGARCLGGDLRIVNATADIPLVDQTRLLRRPTFKTGRAGEGRLKSSRCRRSQERGHRIPSLTISGMRRASLNTPRQSPAPRITRERETIWKAL